MAFSEAAENRRLLILKRAIACGFFSIGLGLFSLQILQGSQFHQQAERNRTRLIHLPAARGSILDRHGVPLVEDRIRFELAIFPQDLKDPSETWVRLSPLVGISPEELARRYRKGYQGFFAPVPLVRNLAPQTAFLLEEKKADLPGTLIRPIPVRRYLSGPAMGPVAGYVGLIAPEELTHLKPYGYTFRDLIGKEGLEQQYDRYLRGQDGGLQVEVDNRGRLVRQLGYRVPQRGRQITVSLDGRLQEFCYSLLKGGPGAILVMDPRNGDLLACVSSPSFDPNAFLDPARQGEVRAALRGAERPLFNRAMRSAVPPGSIFKLAVAYAALKTKKISSGTSFECPGFFQLGRGIFRCWREEGHGVQGVCEALEHSCNVFFFHTGRRLGVEGIRQAALTFGLGRPTGIDLPRETRGLVPDPAWMMARAQQPWQEGDTISFAIGQGPLLVTPLQMLVMVSTIALDGNVPRPHLLLGIEGEEEKKNSRRSDRILLDSEALTAVKIGMERVVSSSTGTGRLARLPGLTAAGKTGTAQVPRGKPHAWFLGYAPADHPKFTFLIFLEHGGKGGEGAAMVARDLLAYLHELHESCNLSRSP